MRHLNRLILVSALSSFSFIACGNDDDDNSNNGGSGGTDGTGATGNTGGSGAGNGTGGNNMGGDGGNSERACTSTIVAEGILDSLGNGGAPAEGSQLIDDFENVGDDGVAWMREVDGRNGYWVSATYLTPADDMNTPATDPEIDDDAGNNYLVLECEDSDDGDAEDAACNTTWSKGVPFQWAAASALFVNDDGVPCYDASVFDGIQFAARAEVAGEKIRLQFNTPSDMREQNNSFNSEEIELTADWKTYKVSFDDVKLEDGGALVNPEELESISFVVRNVKSEKDGTVLGESLEPYEIHLDDVAFFIGE